MPYAVLSSEGLVEEVESSLRGAVRAAQSMGAQDVVIDAAGTGRRSNPEPTAHVRGAVKLLRTPYQRDPIHISERAISMELEEAHQRLAALMPPFTQTGKTGIKKTMDPAKTATSLVDSFLGQNAKLEKRAGGAANVDVQGISMTPYWMFAEAPSPAGLQLRKQLPNLCAGSSPACRHSCLVFAGQNYAADWSIFSKFQKTRLLFSDPEAFGRVLYEACLRHHRNSSKNKFIGAVRLNVLSDVPWEVVFPSLFEALPDTQFYDYTKVYGRQVPRNYDLTFSNSGGNLRNVKRVLEGGGRVAVVALVREWRRGPATRMLPEESKRRWEKRKASEAHRLWSSRLPATCNVGGRDIPVIDGDVNDVRFLDPKPSIIALRWKDPGGQASERAPEALRISERTRFVVEVEEFCGILVGAVTPSEQPDTGIQTVFSLQPLEAGIESNPGVKLWGSGRAGYGKRGR
jgi:hypothetical protein